MFPRINARKQRKNNRKTIPEKRGWNFAADSGSKMFLLEVRAF